MPEVRQAAKKLVQASEIRILQSGEEVDIDQVKGPIRIQLALKVRKRSAFITRSLSANSPFRQRLEAAAWQVSGQSLIAFKPVAFDAPPAVDWVFFYSKRAVQHFFDQKVGVEVSKYAIAAIGPGTAAAVEQFGHSPSFVGNGVPEEVAEAFFSLAKGQRVLFPQARHSRQSIEQLLAGQIDAHSLVVYDNEPVAEVQPSQAQVLVFTSPLNVEAYCSQHNLLEGQYAVAIGQPTAEALGRFAIQAHIAPSPSEEGLVEAVLELAKGLDLK
jgi:uroporphyrinogen-III synthase